MLSLMYQNPEVAVIMSYLSTETQEIIYSCSQISISIALQEKGRPKYVLVREPHQLDQQGIPPPFFDPYTPNQQVEADRVFFLTWGGGITTNSVKSLTSLSLVPSTGPK